MAETTHAKLDAAAIRKLGLDPDRLERIKQFIEQDTGKGLYDGAVFIVARHGTIAAYEAVGSTDLAKKRPAKIDDYFFIMSLTKQMTVVRVLMDIERGKFDLTTPIMDVIPEFGVKGKQRITVWHILTHTSGLNTEIPFTLPVDKLGVMEQVVATLSNERVLYTPGSLMTYNATTAHAIVAVMVQRLDEKKRPFRQILMEDVFMPLGMKDTSFTLTDRFKERIVPVVLRDKTPGLFDASLIEALNFLSNEQMELPAGGGISTANDIFLFSEMLRRGGELNGARVLSPETVKLATSNQTGDMVNHLMDYMREMYGWPQFPAYLGLSFFLRGEGTFPHPFGIGTSPCTYGGLGAGSTMFWVDPERDLSFVFLSAGLMEEGRSFLRHQRLSDMVVSAVVD
jgi:CubicO group peptidase (beta-lactamase class C family)